jgi:adenylate kinase
MSSTIVLLGPPGSGKGTQATRLRDELGLVTLVTGDLLRRARTEGTDLGRRAADYMQRGELVPDALVVDMISDAIAASGDAPILLDGFPRSVAQADALDDALEAQGRALTAVILIDVPDAVAADRISSRGEGRDDDRPETVRERLRVYHEETEPLVARYTARDLLLAIDGLRAPDQVNLEIRQALESAAAAR